MTGAPHFEGFRILDELGSGALSTVHKAVQESLDRVVAIKVLKSSIHPTSPFAAQLEREAKVLGELSHPNVGLLYDFVKSERGMYLVLEYVDGWSLQALLAKKVKLAPEVVAAIGAEVARGLAHAHERGIVHRDIKPANVLISKRGDVKIFDFGIAQRTRAPSVDEPLAKVDDAATDGNASFGTPAYMSPEQILGEHVDQRSDIFALGVVLYELLCGARPFDKGDPNDRRAAAQRIRRDPPVPIHRRAPEVPRVLERIVMRALEKLPIDRYASASVLADHLEEYVRSKARSPRAVLVGRALAKAGLVPADPLAAAETNEVQAIRASVKPTLIGFAALFLMVVVGGSVIQWVGRTGAHRVRAGERPLELVPSAPGALRVLATPWAEVSVDGQKVDTTPFARAIPLSPGTHYVTLKHPNAPVEKRQIEVATGETVMLDIEMQIDGLTPPPPPQGTAADAGSGGRTDSGRSAKGH